MLKEWRLYEMFLMILLNNRIKDKEVLNKKGYNRQLLDHIKRQKVKYLGHITRESRYDFLHFIVNGKIDGQKWIGKKKLCDLRQ